MKSFNEPAPEQVAAVRQELGLSDELAIVCVGRLSTEKGHRDLLQAVAQLRRMPDTPPFRLILVGDGPEREHLTSDAARLDIADICSFAGHRNDVRPWYRVASVFALPSQSEGSPNVVLEAMSAGVPVIATAVGGVPEIMEDGVTGLIVPPRQARMMAEGLARLLRDESLRKKLGAAGRDHISRDFTPEAYVSSLANFYKQVLADWRAR